MKTKENVTMSSIKRMKYTDLQKLCSKKGIEFKGENREKLISLLLSKLSSLEGEIPEAEKVGKQEKKDAVNGITVNNVSGKKKSEKVLKSSKAASNKEKAATKKGETKTARILAMYLNGEKVSVISKALKAHPSFCYTVIHKHKQNKKG
jgi:hypothetical protein